jgi:hypothetical protein
MNWTYVRVLSAAKKYVAMVVRECDLDDADHRQTYVCWAIDEAIEQGKISNNEGVKTKRMIEDRIDGCATVIEWLLVRKGIYIHGTTYEQRQDYRLRWMDAMIAEFSK